MEATTPAPGQSGGGEGPSYDTPTPMTLWGTREDPCTCTCEALLFPSLPLPPPPSLPVCRCPAWTLPPSLFPSLPGAPGERFSSHTWKVLLETRVPFYSGTRKCGQLNSPYLTYHLSAPSVSRKSEPLLLPQDLVVPLLSLLQLYSLVRYGSHVIHISYICPVAPMFRTK